MKPRKQTVAWAIDCLWSILRKIPIPAIQRTLDKEENDVTKDFGSPEGLERVYLQDEGIAPAKNTTLLEYLERIRVQNETGTSSGTFYLNRD